MKLGDSSGRGKGPRQRGKRLKTRRVKLNPANHVDNTVDALYIPPVPRGEQSIRVGGQVPSAVAEQMQWLITSRRTPFQSTNDIVRSALTWFLAEKVAPHLDDRKWGATTRSLWLMGISAGQALVASKLLSSVDRTLDTILELKGKGLKDEAKRLLREQRLRIEALDDETLRAAMLKVLENSPTVQALDREIEREDR